MERTQRPEDTSGRVGERAGEIRVPEVEERLDVEKRPVETGEVQVHKTVEEERQTVPVELRREEATVERRDVGERPLGPGEAERAFQDETIRVPLRGEEAVARKEAVVTGEVVVDKEQTTERQEVGDTVRRERVEVEGDDDQTSAAGAGRRATGSMAGSGSGTMGGTSSGMGSATTGAMAAAATDTADTTDTGDTAGRMHDREMTAGETTRGMGGVGSVGATSGTTLMEDMEVVGSDDEPVGRIKEVREGDFLVDRPAARDVYVPMDAVADVANDQVRLNVQAHEVDDMGWPKPSLF